MLRGILPLNTRAGLISGTLAAASAAPYTVTITASDGTYRTSQTFAWAVPPAVAPAAPGLAAPGAQGNLAGEGVSLPLLASSPGGYPLTYSAVGLPDGLAIDPASGTITGTLADDAAAAGPYAVTVTAADGQDGYVSPAEDFGTLAANADGSYTYTAKDQTRWNFDGLGRLTSVVDPHGLARTYGYNGTTDQLAQVTAPDGGVTTLSYTDGLLSGITEPGGRVLTLTDDANGDLTGITDVDGSGRTLSYDADHHATGDQWAPLDASFTYDPASGLLTQVNRGLGTTYAIDAAAAQGLGSLVAGAAAVAPAFVTDGLGRTTTYLLDGRGRLLQQVLPDGATTTYRRDAAGQVVLALDPLHRPTLYGYAYGASNGSGGDGDLVQVRYADGGFDQYQYDPTFHEPTRDANALGEVTTAAYNGSGDLLRSTDAVGNVTTYTWSDGLLLSTTDPAGAVTSTTYDADRRPAVTFDALGVPTFLSYDAAGNLATTTDALQRTTQTVYSGRNQLLATQAADGSTTTQTYDAYGLPVGSKDARGFTTSTTYDQRGFAVQTTDATGAVTAYQYDAAGNLLKQTDPDGHATTYQYDADTAAPLPPTPRGTPPSRPTTPPAR